MLGDLVKFNMTNDIQLSVDMRAGQEPGTTDYEIFVQEPDPRTFTLFSDSSGSKSSGRYRGGVSFTERSLLGWRDRLQLIGVFSHGSRSFMGSYSVPLNSFPTLAADSGFFHLEARIHRAFQNFKIYVGVATTFVSGKCSFLLKADGLSTRLRTSKLNSADIRSNKPTS